MDATNQPPPEPLLAAIDRHATDADASVKACIRDGIDGRARALYEGAAAAYSDARHLLTVALAELNTARDRATDQGHRAGLAFAVRHLGGTVQP